MVVRDTGRGISLVAVQLPRIDSKHIVRHRRVTGQAVRRTRIIPGLRGHARRVGDRNVFRQTAREQIRVAVVRPPFVSHAINRAVDVAHKEPGFQTMQNIGVGRIGVELKSFDKHRAGWKQP